MVVFCAKKLFILHNNNTVKKHFPYELVASDTIANITEPLRGRCDKCNKFEATTF